MELTTISPRVLHIREVIDRDVVQWLDSRQKLITRLLTTNQLQACASLLQDFDKGVDDLLLCRRKIKIPVADMCSRRKQFQEYEDEDPSDTSRLACAMLQLILDSCEESISNQTSTWPSKNRLEKTIDDAEVIRSFPWQTRTELKSKMLAAYTSIVQKGQSQPFHPVTWILRAGFYFFFHNHIRKCLNIGINC